MNKILIAEDSPTQALQLQMILEENNFEVIHGVNGKEALALIDENNLPDLIITDIIMPKMDGYEFCSKIKGNKKTENIPVILLTQLSDYNDVIKGIQAGADNFISKPYSEKFLLERISDILINRKLRERLPNLELSMEIVFAGQKHTLNSNRMQILDLLLSTYHNAVDKNNELKIKNVLLNKLHKDLKFKNIQLKKSIDEKNNLLGIAAHDLRSPLATVSGYINLALESLPKNIIENQEMIFFTINDTLNYMLNLVTEVLDYAKIESSTLTLKHTEFDLIEFMDEAINLNSMFSKKKNINIYSKYPAKKMMIRADKNKLRQVMDNLFSNGIKYSERRTNIHVHINSSEKEVLVKVVDQGKGIPKEEVSLIFDPFVTTSVKGTEGEKSIGLGLVSVKKIIETHGGRIWVKSEVGVGSEFYFTIPKS